MTCALARARIGKHPHNLLKPAANLQVIGLYFGTTP